MHDIDTLFSRCAVIRNAYLPNYSVTVNVVALFVVGDIISDVS